MTCVLPTSSPVTDRVPRKCPFNTYFHRYVDQKQDSYVKLLEEAVAIKSVSAWPETRPEIRRMVLWVKQVRRMYSCLHTSEVDMSDLTMVRYCK